MNFFFKPPPTDSVISSEIYKPGYAVYISYWPTAILWLPLAPFAASDEYQAATAQFHGSYENVS